MLSSVLSHYLLSLIINLSHFFSEKYNQLRNILDHGQHNHCVRNIFVFFGSLDYFVRYQTPTPGYSTIHMLCDLVGDN